MKRVLLGMLLLVASSLAADPGFNDVEGALKALRTPDKAQLLQALSDVRGLPGFPKGAKVLLPAVLWLSDSSDMDVAVTAQGLVKDLGWPKIRCMDCLRQFARRQDKVYQLMGIAALRKLAFLDPAAYVALLELSASPNNGVADTVQKSGGALKRELCPEPQDLVQWNTQAHDMISRFQDAFDHCDKHAKGLLKVLVTCQGLDADVVQGAQEALDRIKDE